jgi:hypothetical protein
MNFPERLDENIKVMYGFNPDDGSSALLCASADRFWRRLLLNSFVH